jgi:CheY-like chemotaxis protein
MRSHSESAVTVQEWRPEAQQALGARPVLLLAVPHEDVDGYPVTPFTRITAGTTAEAIRLMKHERPRCVAVDLDQSNVDGLEICRAALELPSSIILVTTSSPERVPAVLKTGCDAVLLKPFSRNLLAARLGRLFREPLANRNGGAAKGRGTNRVWPATACPDCQTDGATSFEFASHRKMWYACLACEHVWLGRRQE